MLALLATTACVGLPDTGPVVPAEDEVGTRPQAEVERRAAPPQEGAPAQVVVTGFLQAMTAYPVRIEIARQFLASNARDAWDPSRKIITYEGRGSVRGEDMVKVAIQRARWVDDRGTWRGKRGSGEVELEFPMIKEDGEWRIAKAPNAFIVTDDWFQDRYRPASVYYLDPTAGILVPEPVFVPIEQEASALVQALLDGPGPQLDDVVSSFVPEGLKLGLSVPISDDGVATIALEGDSGPLPPDAATLMIYQFAWTLRQDPRITSFAITIGDQPVTLDGSTPLSVDLGSEYDPTDVAASSLLFSLHNGLLESGDAESMTAVDGTARPQPVRRLRRRRQPHRRPGGDGLHRPDRVAADLGQRRPASLQAGSQRGDAPAEAQLGLRRPVVARRPQGRRCAGEHGRHGPRRDHCRAGRRTRHHGQAREGLHRLA